MATGDVEFGAGGGSGAGGDAYNIKKRSTRIKNCRRFGIKKGDCRLKEKVTIIFFF